MTNARAKAYFLLFVLFFPLLVGFVGLVPVSASVIIAQSATADPAEATTQEFQQHVFQAKGRYWVFYSDGSDILFETSLDGTTWSSPTTITDCGVLGAYSTGHHFSLHYSPSFDRVAYACGATHQIGDRGDDNRGFYRQGLPNSDGTITWDAAEQVYTVAATTSLNQSWMPTITIDRENKSWITASKDYYASATHPGNNGSLWVTQSSSTDGTWTTASGFPKLLNSSNTNDRGWNPIVVSNSEPTGWRVAVIYSRAYENYTQAYSYEGTTWTHETIHTDYNDTLSFTKDALVIDGIIYLIQRFGSGESMHFFSRTALGVWSELGSSPAPDAGGPAIGATIQEDKIILVYAWGNQIRYRLYDIEDGTWTTESFLDSYVGAVPNGIQSSYQTRDLIAEWTENDGASPYPVWFAIYNPLTFGGLTVGNAECGNWVAAQGGYYDFNMTYTVDPEFGYTMDTAQVAFEDGLGNWVNATYDPEKTGRAAWILDAGHDVAELATGSVAIDGGTYYITFPFYFEHDIGDAVDIDIYQYVNTTDGLTEGWTLSEADAFTIYNLGGFIETASSGTAGRIAGGDVFELYAEEGASGSWAAANQTWQNLQSINTLFAYRMTDGGAGEDQFFQDATHDGGTEVSSDKGDWQLRISIYYCDPSDVWVEGWAALLQMEQGDEGADDEWHGINVTWYQRGSLVDTDVFYTFIEEEPLAQTRIFLDLWFNQVNASQTWGGRIGAYYHAMQKSAWLMWGDWSPFMTNQSQAMAFGQLEDNTGADISAPQLSLMKIGFNVSRPTTQAGENDFRITLQDFDLFEPRRIEATMKGVSTPVFVSPKVPDMPTGDFWGPIIGIFSDLIDALLEQVTIIGDQIWTFLVDNIPYLGEFYGMLIDSWDLVWNLFSTIWGHLLNLFTVLVDLLYLVTYPIRIVGDMWARLGLLWEELGFDVSASAAAALVLVFFGMWVFVAITDGDWNALEGMASRAWKITSAIMEWSYKIVTILINVVLKLAGVIGNYLPFT